jgi:hypothetical protein
MVVLRKFIVLDDVIEDLLVLVELVPLLRKKDIDIEACGVLVSAGEELMPDCVLEKVVIDSGVREEVSLAVAVEEEMEMPCAKVATRREARLTRRRKMECIVISAMFSCTYVRCCTGCCVCNSQTE